MASFSIELDDRGAGEIRGRLAIESGGQELGHCLFIERDHPRGGRNGAILWVEVDPEHRREGIASQLFEELRRRYPETPINRPFMTEPARQLFEKLAPLHAPRDL